MIEYEYRYNGTKFSILEKDAMMKGAYYFGFCRNASVAQWTGEQFIHVRTKFGSTFLEKIKHPEDEYHYDVFMVQGLLEASNGLEPDIIGLVHGRMVRPLDQRMADQLHENLHALKELQKIES